MIFAKLEESKTDRMLYKSFQPIEERNAKKDQTIMSNIEPTNGGLIPGQKTTRSHLDYLNESIKDVSSNEESVADERELDEEKTTVHPTIPNPHQNL